jgi:hypothetical protein
MLSTLCRTVLSVYAYVLNQMCLYTVGKQLAVIVYGTGVPYREM